MPIRCFLLTPTDIVEQTVWAYSKGCPGSTGQHVAEVVVATLALPVDQPLPSVKFEWPHGQPMICHYCNQEFAGSVESTGSGRHWIRADTGEVKRRISDFGPGAMWYAYWYDKDGQQRYYGWDWDNQFEPPLMVATPGGDWCIDSRAPNCNMPEERTHRCWIRHGQPPDITVDKNGFTCGAGAGSIQSGSYHGFLRDGYLTD